jgi:hypothetical protein
MIFLDEFSKNRKLENGKIVVLYIKNIDFSSKKSDKTQSKA